MLVFHEQPHAPVRVFVDFNGKRIQPKAFFWGGRRYDVASVNLVYQRRRGKGHDWCFAVSDASNSYVLAYNPESLVWTLEEVQGQ